MLSSTFGPDAIVRPNSGAEIGILFPTLQERFLIRETVTERLPLNGNQITQASSQGQHVSREDILVRLPSLRESKGKVTVLQRWIGQVVHVKAHQFLAILSDTTNPKNPPEEVELELSEVSESDRSLLTEGATFYWSIGYRDTAGGQRERISTLRLARHPRLSKAYVKPIFEHADRLAALLESD